VSQTDAGLIRRAQQGDQQALVDIYQRCQPSIYTYIFYRIGDQALSEDLTAEVFVRMIDKLPAFVQDKRPILAWLYTIARNLVIDHYRRAGKQVPLLIEESLMVDDELNRPPALVEQRLNRQNLIKALRHLTEEQRQVIVLKFVEDRSNAEVAVLLDKTEGAVKSLQHRALAALQRVLEQELSYER
jgi:RNA polymerase sigma-70 factor (ECF subfamily)